jgi:hypothetical protein
MARLSRFITMAPLHKIVDEELAREFNKSTTGGPALVSNRWTRSPATST